MSKSKITRKQAIKKLKVCQAEALHDQENAHVESDRILCELLIALGHEDVVKEYRIIPKWYA